MIVKRVIGILRVTVVAIVETLRTHLTVFPCLDFCILVTNITTLTGGVQLVGSSEYGRCRLLLRLLLRRCLLRRCLRQVYEVFRALENDLIYGLIYHVLCHYYL